VLLVAAVVDTRRHGNSITVDHSPLSYESGNDTNHSPLSVNDLTGT